MNDDPIEVQTKDSAGRPPLHDAAKRSDEDAHQAVIALLEKGADVDARNDKAETPVDIADAHDATQTAEVLRAHVAALLCKL